MQSGVVREVGLKIRRPSCQPIVSPVRRLFPSLGVIRYGLKLMVILLFLALPRNAQGQTGSITASVNKSQFTTDELIILTVRIVDDSAQQPRPLLPRLDGLAVVDLGLATSVDTINGKIYTEVVYTYHLQPRRTGSLTIPPIAVEMDGQIVESQPIFINVSQGAAPVPVPGNAVAPDDITPPDELNGQDFFVESVVDLETPYVTQQIIHTFRFYQAIQLHKKPKYDEPLFPGFEKIGLPVRQYNFDISDRTYLITEIRTMLFPKTPGRLTVQPARLVLLGNYYEEPVEMYTEPVTVEVQPLPDDAPPGFNGAVGQYEIKAWFKPQVTVINQPATFYVAVSGTGNMNLLPEPIWPQLNWWRAYDTLTSLTTDLEEDKLMTGTRVFERLIVPGQVGDHTILPATLVYFDPIASEYRTIATEPLTVQVIPVPTPAPTTPTATAQPPTATPASVANLSTPGAAQPEQVSQALFDTVELRAWLFQMPVYTVLLATLCSVIPLAAIAGASGLWLWQRRGKAVKNQIEQADPSLSHVLKKIAAKRPAQSFALVKSKPDTRIAPLRPTIHPALTAAMRENDDNYKTVQQALTNYLNTALKKSINGVTRAELASQLSSIGLDEALTADVEQCLSEAEAGRYSPLAKDAGWSLMAATDSLLFKLDEVLKSD